MRRRTPLRVHKREEEVCSPEERRRIVGQLPFFAGLPEDEVTEINRRFEDLGYERGEVIYHEGSLASQLFAAATGRVKLARTAASGQEVLINVLAKGDYFGALPALGEKTYRETATALTDCCILAAGEQDFGEILSKYPRAALNTLNLVAGRLQAAEDTIHGLSAAPLANRLAAVLLKLGAKFGEKRPGGLLIQAPLSRQDLAAMTGSTPEATSRILSRFKQNGWITSGREWIALSNLDALKKLADEV